MGEPTDRTLPPPEAGPRTVVAIHILDDGRVIFGDLPPELAEVADILRGAPDAQAQGDADDDSATRAPRPH